MFAPASCEKLRRGGALERWSTFCSMAGFGRKEPIISLGIWAGLPNDEEDQMLGNQRSQLVCARAKKSPITKRAFTLLELLHPAVGSGGYTWILGSPGSPICQTVLPPSCGQTKPGLALRPNLMTGPEHVHPRRELPDLGTAASDSPGTAFQAGGGLYYLG